MPKRLLLFTILYFFIVHTSYFWSGRLNVFFLPVFLSLVISYVVLVVNLFIQIYKSISERFHNKIRIQVIEIMFPLLFLTFIFPEGVIDFSKYEGVDVLVATYEGVANCTDTITLKDSGLTKSKSVCFGITEDIGEYSFINDTIYISYKKSIFSKERTYKFGIIRRHPFTKEKDNLIVFSDKKDSVVMTYLIRKNLLSTNQ
ncbi:hypothetical protein BWI96_05195 [Siphonobacter sp. SORGH_AS_0500]|uniref:hypothetical protein n=1 Tax=Siphonobacter sp. SORGH_AS_0500 TaxID=1864824 RepID=UPI000CB4032B|nr:hypothetical protein [Siphonobacter sp. SORGH_AS_0500]PKK37857.1 hypothetical protein BWI96_05195 [Siphonobacter sp. SORGH_AS_0500]